jgi:antitoxin (DNA-binding transcriptional repressor) of toxin-antitoxin stability system
MTAITISQARAVLPELLRRVEEGEEITITRHGQAVAVLVRPDVLRPRMEVVIEDSVRIHELVAAAAGTELPGRSGLTLARAEQLIDEIRAGRDGR